MALSATNTALSRYRELLQQRAELQKSEIDLNVEIQVFEKELELALMAGSAGPRNETAEFIESHRDQLNEDDLAFLQDDHRGPGEVASYLGISVSTLRRQAAKGRSSWGSRQRLAGSKPFLSSGRCSTRRLRLDPMSKQPVPPKLSSDHPMIAAGFVHESTVMETLGYQWSTWERDYRTKIPGLTTPTGRWFHRDGLVRWFIAVSEPEGSPKRSIDRQ